MNSIVFEEFNSSKLGKEILDDLYIHIDYIDQIQEIDSFSKLIKSALSATSPEILDFCNVVKVNITRNRISFLQYLNFEEDPFPTLNGSWVFDALKQTFTLRSYATSLNPPILHRKELLVGEDHPNRSSWIEVTKTAEQIGLFSTGNPIGFKLNWLKLITEKGFRLEGNQFLPLGNLNDSTEFEDSDTSTAIQRHLTALSRSSLSAPIQLMISNGLISQSVDIFDYGCGRGDDLKGLKEFGFNCQGWDPHYANDNPLTPADIVNLGFVVNVIEDPAERVEAIKNAFKLARVALVVSVMLHSKDRPGKPYLDGFLTSRNTFQKYFSQDELKDYLENILGNDPIMLGPGIAVIFSNKEAEQRFLLGKYRSSNVARRLLNARLKPFTARIPREKKSRVPRLTKYEREYEANRLILESIWTQTLNLGRFPEPLEILEFENLQSNVSLIRLKRLIRTYFDQELLEKSAKTRSDEIKLFFASRLFGKKSPYKELDLRLKTDIRHFFGDYKSANQAALELLISSSNPEEIRKACEEAAADGIGWLEGNSHSLQLDCSLIERLPIALRAYVTCGLILWDNISDFQQIKIHVHSGKLTLLQYANYDNQAIPLLIKRIKINIPKLDYDVFEYEPPSFPPPPLLFKSRYMNEDLVGFAEQMEFDEKLEATGILDIFSNIPTIEQIQNILNLKRLEISGIKLQKNTSLPPLDQQCGQNFTFRDLIHCGETQLSLGIPNLPFNPDTYNALYTLCTEILDPVIDYFGAIKLTYGFCSSELSGKIKSRIAPKLDQHAGHERNRMGKPICERLGAAVDFIIEDEDMIEVAIWIAENLKFDRIYIYGRRKPIHISNSSNQAMQITFMVPAQNGKLIPRTCQPEKIAEIATKLSSF